MGQLPQPRNHISPLVFSRMTTVWGLVFNEAPPRAGAGRDFRAGPAT